MASHVTFDATVNKVAPATFVGFNKNIFPNNALSKQPQRLLLIGKAVKWKNGDSEIRSLGHILVNKDNYFISEAKNDAGQELDDAIKAAKAAFKDVDIYVKNMDISAYKDTSVLDDDQYTQIAIACGYKPEGTGTPAVPSNLGKLKKVITKINGELKDRWDATRDNDGILFLSSSQIGLSVTEATTPNIPNEFKSDHLVVMDDPDHLATVAIAASNAYEARSPAIPYTDIRIAGIKRKSGPKYDQRNARMLKGYSTYCATRGEMRVEWLQSTSHLNLNDQQALSYVRYDLIKFMERYKRSALSKEELDGAGVAVVTPKLLKNALINRYGKWKANLLVQDPNGEATKRIDVNFLDDGRVGIILPLIRTGLAKIFHIVIATKGA